MQITINISDNVDLGQVTEHDIKMLLACKLYETGILDTGYAAKSIGMERVYFEDEMRHYGINIFDRTEEELEEDTRNAGKFFVQQPS